MKHRPTRSIAALLTCLAPAVEPALAHPGLHHEIERVTEALRRSPDRIDLLIERAHIYRLDDQPTASLLDLRHARTLDHDNPRIACELGFTLSAMGRDEEADAELTACLDVVTGHAAALAERGRVRSRTGRPAAAIEDFSAALRRRDDVDVYIARGRLQESMGRWQDAAVGYRTGLERMHGAVVLRLALIRVETARGRYDAALDLIDEVLPTVHVKTHWLLRRAEILDAAGRTQQAHAERRRALIEADRALTRRATAINRFARAKVYVAMGKRAEAVGDLNAAIARSPGFAEAKELLRTLERKQSDGPEHTP